MEQQHREASKAAAREQAEKVQRWLAEQSHADAPLDTLPPAGVSVSDVAFEMVRSLAVSTVASWTTELARIDPFR
eukprot:COSAG02_NODE_2093_length_9852_cov_2.404286_5_plen_75_part_00